jgi:hypothetical protein
MIHVSGNPLRDNNALRIVRSNVPQTAFSNESLLAPNSRNNAFRFCRSEGAEPLHSDGEKNYDAKLPQLERAPTKATTPSSSV